MSSPPSELRLVFTGVFMRRLLQADQLIAERQRGAIFSAFNEAQITFKPSYKFDRYTQQYDTSKKNRSPAWCDRIMFASNPLYSISPDRYFCVYDSCHSDHRPVVGTFTIQLSSPPSSAPPPSPPSQKVSRSAPSSPTKQAPSFKEQLRICRDAQLFNL